MLLFDSNEKEIHSALICDKENMFGLTLFATYAARSVLFEDIDNIGL